MPMRSLHRHDRQQAIDHQHQDHLVTNLERDIEAMPMGMHTVLLDGAGARSGGQRQRILIARALVGKPGSPLLDEATSALDNRTQPVVTETLSRLGRHAHRLSTIGAADRIIVLENAKWPRWATSQA